jgi:hypothetical protein
LWEITKHHESRDSLEEAKEENNIGIMEINKSGNYEMEIYGMSMWE